MGAGVCGQVSHVRHHHEAETLAGHSWADVSAGSSFTCALTTTGRAICWGCNHFGEADVPASILIDVASGFDEHACGLEDSKAIACWGEGWDGQLAVPRGLEWSSVSVGWLHSCGVVEARRLGATPSSPGTSTDESGDGNDDDVEVGDLPTRVVDGSSTLKVDGDDNLLGTIMCWGNNDFGQSDPPTLCICGGRPLHHLRSD